MRVKPLILAIITCCSLQTSAAIEITANVAHKAIIPLDNPQRLLKTAQTKNGSCARVNVDNGGGLILGAPMDGPPLVAGFDLAARSIVSRRTAP
ncbi:hypothetical protein RZO07_18400 [Pseudomonas protegens]|uniref:hypothetical protein n=1 Tax=Pseudomonas protegens TaxID=380021 RepID=UPI002937121C|nr:hypothetical protein [Pseudomonas protegens]WOE77301.1 hypothetical protein RZO07_18400 [Pseudomonas protegens]